MSFRKKKDKGGEQTAAIVEAKTAVVRNQADLLSQLSSSGGIDSIFGDEPESNSPPEPAPVVYSCPVPGPRIEIKPTVPKPTPVSVPAVGLPKISIPSAVKPPTVEYGAPVPGPPKAVPAVSVPTVSVPPVVVKVALPTVSIPSVSIPSVSVPTVSVPTVSVPAAASLPPPVFSVPQPEPVATSPPPKETPSLSSSGTTSPLPAPPPRGKKSPAPPPPTNVAPDPPPVQQDDKEEEKEEAQEPEEPEKVPSPAASPDKSEATRTASPVPVPKPRSFKPSPSSPAIISSAPAPPSVSPRQADTSENAEEVAQSSPRASSPSTGSGDRKSWGWTKPKENARVSTPSSSRLQLGKQSSSALGRSSKEMNEEASEAMTLLSNESNQTQDQPDNSSASATSSATSDAQNADLEQYKVGYCIYDYDIMNEGEIELKNGDYVIIMQEAGEWLYVRCGESYGYVAASYVQIISEDTLHEQSIPTEEPSPAPLTNSNETQSAPIPQVPRDPSPKRGTASSLQTPVTMYELRQRAMSINRPVLAPSGGISSGSTPNSPPRSPQTSRAPPMSAVDAKNKKMKKGTTFGSFRGLKKKKKEPEFEFQITRVETPASPLQTSASTSALMTNSGSLPDSIPHSSSTPSLAQSGSVDVLTRSDPSPEHTLPVEDVDQRTKIAREILSTEEHYVNILDALLKKYRDPLRAKVATEGFGVTDQQIKDIFSNLHLILPINQELLEELRTKVKKEWSDSQSIGDTFARVAPFLKMYNQYGNNYNNALQTFNRCMQKPTFVAAVEECDSNTNISTRLDGLLITPVQRLPRYLMLLTEIKRHTPEGHPDHAFLDKAIPAMQEVADHVNNYIRQSENQLKLMELSVKGAQSLLKPHRSLISESILSDESKKRKVHIYVFNDILVHLSEAKAKNKANLTKNENQWPWHLVWIDPDPIAGLSSSSGSKKADCTEVIGPTGSYLLKSLTQATALEDSQKWKTLFQQTIVQHLEHLNVTQDPELQFEKDAKMRQDRPERYGSFVFPESGGSYTGWWLNGLMHGEGTFKFYNMTYEGGFQLNKKHGYGVLTYATGETYQGQWAADKQNGAGTFTYQNGDVYVGHWKDGKKSGKGELTCKNGEHYTGDWLDDVPDGLGEMRYANNTVYTGNWKMGLRDMYGILISFGQKYEGQFELGTISGKGRMEWADGTVYDGLWKDGLKHGTGTYTSPIFGKYVGEWAFDCKEGKGTQEYPDGTIYNGIWKRNMYNGAGSLTFTSGIIKAYKGEFVNNSRHGRGTLDLANGDNYEGHFKDNHLHGNGVYRWASGATLEAKFTRDKPDGKCTFTPPLVDDGSKKKKKVKEEKKAILYTGDYCDGMIFASEGPPIYIPSFPVIEINFRP